MTTTIHEERTTPAVPSQADSEVAKAASLVLARFTDGELPLTVEIRDAHGQGATVLLPAVAAQLLRDILEQLAAGHAVTVLPVEAELTTQQAADLLNVSRPYLVQLLEDRQLPYRKVGTHRRVLLGDVLAYKARVDAARKDSLDQLAALSQQLGLPY